MVGLPLILFQVGVEDVGDIIDLAKLEFNSKLIDMLSSEFTGNADQITYVPASGKTFYHIKSKLYPVNNTIVLSTTASVVNRRADVEITFDGTIKDVLTYDWESQSATVSDPGVGGGNAGQFESNTSESLEGDAIKAIKLTSTNNSGTFRVHMKGFIEDTGTEPSA